MLESTKKAQKKYRQSTKGKEATRRASAKAAGKLKAIGISKRHKADLILIAKHCKMTQKQVIEHWVESVKKELNL